MRWKSAGVAAGSSVKKLSARFSGRLPTTLSSASARPISRVTAAASRAPAASSSRPARCAAGAPERRAVCRSLRRCFVVRLSSLARSDAHAGPVHAQARKRGARHGTKQPPEGRAAHRRRAGRAAAP
jgi:hypothetical protein